MTVKRYYCGYDGPEYAGTDYGQCVAFDEYQAAIAERNAAQRELLEHTNHFADVRRIEEWLATTKPAHLAFTDGPERQVASHLEGLRQERDAALAELSTLKQAEVAAKSDRPVNRPTRETIECYRKLSEENNLGYLYALGAVKFLLAEHDAALAECEQKGREIENLSDFGSSAIDLLKGAIKTVDGLKADLTRANEAIRNMGNQFDQQAQRDAATIAAMARRCEKCDEAVGLLRRWYKSNWNCGPLPLATERFIATIDAEEKKLKEAK